MNHDVPLKMPTVPNDRAAAKLKGPVLSFQLERTQFEPKALVYRQGVEYTRDGRIAKSSIRDPGSEEVRLEYVYDNQGNLREQRCSRGNAACGATVYVYDDQDRLKAITYTSVTGFSTVLSANEYGSSGKTVTEYLSSWRGLSGEGFLLNGFSLEDQHVVFANAAVLITTYDASGRAAKSLAYDGEHKPVVKVVRQYSAAGKLKELSVLFAASTVPRELLEAFANSGFNQGRSDADTDEPAFVGAIPNRTRFEYDAQGQTISRIIYWGDMEASRKVTSYNEHGDEETVTNYAGERQTPAAGRRQQPSEGNHFGDYLAQSTFNYVYDQWGNWTEKKLLTSQGSHLNQEATPPLQSFERRALSYW